MTESETDPSAKSFDDLRARAEVGDSEAQYTLGVAYAESTGVPQDAAEAERLYRLAADQDLAEAQSHLASMYRQGVGVGQDDIEAVQWTRLAADQGYALAQYNLGRMYAGGRGVPQDDEEAVRYYRLSAEQNHLAAQEQLESMSAKGRVVPQNDEPAATVAHEPEHLERPSSKRRLTGGTRLVIILTLPYWAFLFFVSQNLNTVRDMLRDLALGFVRDGNMAMANLLRRWWQVSNEDLLGYAFGVPLFFLGMTWLIRWTIRGFKSSGF